MKITFERLTSAKIGIIAEVECTRYVKRSGLGALRRRRTGKWVFQPNGQELTQAQLYDVTLHLAKLNNEPLAQQRQLEKAIKFAEHYGCTSAEAAANLRRVFSAGNNGRAGGADNSFAANLQRVVEASQQFPATAPAEQPAQLGPHVMHGDGHVVIGRDDCQETLLLRLHGTNDGFLQAIASALTTQRNVKMTPSQYQWLVNNRVWRGDHWIPDLPTTMKRLRDRQWVEAMDLTGAHLITLWNPKQGTLFAIADTPVEECTAETPLLAACRFLLRYRPGLPLTAASAEEVEAFKQTEFYKDVTYEISEPFRKGESDD